MSQEKSHYPLDEAAAILDCTSKDLIHLAGKGEVVLVIGVPDGIRFRTYDAHADRTEMPALLEPELLALSTSQCQKIELNGRTEQSDFRVGYLIAPEGGLQRLMPSYGGRLYLDHGWAFWRTYKGPYIKEIELTADRLFVLGQDVRRFLVNKSKPESKEKPKNNAAKLAEQSQEKKKPANLEEGDQVTPTADSQIKKPAPVTVNNTASPAVMPGIIRQAERETPLVILRMPDVIERTGLSKSTIYDKLNPKSPRFDPTFPKRRNLGVSTVGWVQSEIDTWLASRPVVSNRLDN